LNGGAVLRVTGAGSVNGQQLIQNVPLEPGKIYTLSAWVRAEGLQKINDPASNAQVGVIITDWRWTRTIVLAPPAKFTDQWQRYTYTFTAPEAYLVGGVEQPCRMRIFLPSGEKGTLLVTGIQIEEGRNASDFQAVSVTEKNDASKALRKAAAHLQQIEESLAKFEGATKESLQRDTKSLREKISTLENRLKEPESQSPQQWHQLTSEGKQLIEEGEKAGILGWWNNAWQDLGLRALPQTQENKNIAKVSLGVNDYGALLLPVANLTGNSIPVEVQVGTDKAPFSTLSALAGPISVSRALMVSHQGLQMNTPVTTEREFPYFLEPLGNGNTTLLASGETGQLWLDISSKDLAPGEHTFPVRLKALNLDYVWEGKIVIEVLPVDLPERIPTNVLAFAAEPFYREPFRTPAQEWPLLKLSAQERLEIARPWLSAWEQMGFNRLMLTNQFLKVDFNEDGSLREEIDYSLMDAYRELWTSIGADLWGGYNLAAYHIYPSWKNKATLKTNDFHKARTRAVFQSLLDYTKKSGLEAENFPISMFDEPHREQIDVTRQGREVLKEIDPKWPVLATVSGTTAADLKDLMPIVDIFVVRQRMGQMDMRPEAIKALKAAGKKVWGYSCSGSFEYTNPYRYYRLLPWQAWANGLEGYGIFMTFDESAYENLGAKAAYFSPLFLGKQGPVFGKGARAFQQGGRDWCLFATARGLARELRDGGAAEEADQLQGHLDKCVRQGLSQESDATVADAARTELLHEVSRIKQGRASE
jgi:hypothetical protein